jgi:hypothetical protein
LSSRGWVRGKTRGEYKWFMKLMKFKKKRGKIRCLLLHRKKIFLYIFMM